MTSQPRALPLPVAAFAADVLIFTFTIAPLAAWSQDRFGTPGWGILAHYGLRAVSAALFAVWMVQWRAVSFDDLGLRAGPRPGEDARWAVRCIAALAVISVVLMAVGVAVIRLFDLPLTQWPLETQKLGWPAYLAASVVAAPLVEEFVYRSLLTPPLRQGYGDRGAIVAGAALFYVLHLVYGQPWWMVHYLAAGAILTWAFLRRGRLWICVLLHAGGNLLVVVDDATLQFLPKLFKAIVGGLPEP